jgi:DNA-binding NarL/FixJ family response regulator
VRGGTAIGVLLVDEQAVTRLGLRTILGSTELTAGGSTELPSTRLGAGTAGAAEDGIRVVGECATAAEALDLAAKLRPHVAIVDLMSDGATGLALIKDLPVQSEHTRTLVYSSAVPADMIQHLLSLGALGYLRKDEPPERVTEAVRRVAAGKIYLDPDSAGDVLAKVTRPTRNLSGCELEVLHLIGAGHDTRSIADILHRSVKTIETYRSRIRKKLELKNPTALAQAAWRFVHGVGVSAALDRPLHV